ncbi:MAG TPA: hypothetical protein VG452_07880 [Egibacteraceae bacterium]|nr:hypothetical protein [Actinomycetota bacterium]HWB72122.1 hypothetical protein [Egibacteraceae bacterium]
MDHLVRFTTAEGREGAHYADGLDDALRFVERARNSQEVSQVRVFRLHEVPIQFRAYYKVELAADGGPPLPGEVVAAGTAAADPGAERGTHAPVPASAGGPEEEHQSDANGRRRFGRG